MLISDEEHKKRKQTQMRAALVVSCFVLWFVSMMANLWLAAPFIMAGWRNLLLEAMVNCLPDLLWKIFPIACLAGVVVFMVMIKRKKQISAATQGFLDVFLTVMAVSVVYLIGSFLFCAIGSRLFIHAIAGK